MVSPRVRYGIFVIIYIHFLSVAGANPVWNGEDIPQSNWSAVFYQPITNAVQPQRNASIKIQFKKPVDSIGTEINGSIESYSNVESVYLSPAVYTHEGENLTSREFMYHLQC